MISMPFHECAKRAEAIAKAGGQVFQKFTCESCRAVVTMVEHNIFFMRGKCPDCGHTTDLTRKGCGFMVIFSFGDKPEDAGRLN